MSDNEIREFIVTRSNGEMDRNSSRRSLKKRLTENQVNQIIADIRETPLRRPHGDDRNPKPNKIAGARRNRKILSAWLDSVYRG
jgi:hypothetical protein